MSSTSRGGQRSPADYYATPAWCVHRLLESLQLPGGHWLEFAAGEGAIVRAINEKRNDVAWWLVELREQCASRLKGLGSCLVTNFLDVPPIHVDVAISNPPFSIAMEMILHSLKFAPWVIHLLRLNFLGTEERNEFFHNNMPDVYVIPNRVSFTADGKADSIEYAWFVWGPDRNKCIGKVEVLNSTPVGQRRPR